MVTGDFSEVNGSWKKIAYYNDVNKMLNWQ